jgi:hypothetical protein
VDDLILIGSKIVLIKELKNDLKKNFKMVDLGVLLFRYSIWLMGYSFLSLSILWIFLLDFTSDCKSSPTLF